MFWILSPWADGVPQAVGFSAGTGSALGVSSVGGFSPESYGYALGEGVAETVGESRVSVSGLAGGAGAASGVGWSAVYSTGSVSGLGQGLGRGKTAFQGEGSAAGSGDAQAIGDGPLVGSMFGIAHGVGGAAATSESAAGGDGYSYSSITVTGIASYARPIQIDRPPRPVSPVVRTDRFTAGASGLHRDDRIIRAAHTPASRRDRKPSLVPEHTEVPGDGYAAGAGVAEAELSIASSNGIGWGYATGASSVEGEGLQSIAAAGWSEGLGEARAFSDSSTAQGTAAGVSTAHAVGRSQIRGSGGAAGVSDGVSVGRSLLEAKGYGAGAGAADAEGVTIGARVYTVSLVHFDGANGAQSVLDEVPSVGWSFANQVYIDTSQYVFGGASAVNYANGGSTIIGTGMAGLSGTGDFTVEAWMRAGYGASIAISATVTSGNGGFYFQIGDYFGALYSSFQAFDTTGNVLIDLSPAPPGTYASFHHVAFVRSGVNFHAYCDGALIASAASAGSIGNIIQEIILNASGTGATCSIDELRVSNIARYTGATYSLPTAAFVVD